MITIHVIAERNVIEFKGLQVHKRASKVIDTADTKDLFINPSNKNL